MSTIVMRTFCLRSFLNPTELGLRRKLHIVTQQQQFQSFECRSTKGKMSGGLGLRNIRVVVLTKALRTPVITRTVSQKDLVEPDDPFVPSVALW